jgi:hypothetical protein
MKWAVGRSPASAADAASRPAPVLPFFARLLGQADELGMACGDRREVEAIGFNDVASTITAPAALAVRTVLHGDQPGLGHSEAVQRL